MPSNRFEGVEYSFQATNEEDQYRILKNGDPWMCAISGQRITYKEAYAICEGLNGINKRKEESLRLENERKKKYNKSKRVKRDVEKNIDTRYGNI